MVSWYKLFSLNLTKGSIARRGVPFPELTSYSWVFLGLDDRRKTKWVTCSGMLEKWMKRCCKWQVISIYKLEDSTVLWPICIFYPKRAPLIPERIIPHLGRSHFSPTPSKLPYIIQDYYRRMDASSLKNNHLYAKHAISQWSHSWK